MSLFRFRKGVKMAYIKRRKLKTKVSYQAMVRRVGYKTLVKSFATRSDAKKWANQMERSYDKGISSDFSEANRYMMRDILKRYLNEEKGKHKKGWKEEVYRANKMLSDPICDRNLLQLSTKDISEYKIRRLEEVSPTTFNKDLSFLKTVVDIAILDWGISIPFNPCRNVKRLKQPRPRTRRLEGDEQTRLIEACAISDNKYLKSMVQFSIETAIRQGELLKLTAKQINWNDRTMTLLDTKNGLDREVPLSEKAILILKSQILRIDGKIFPMTKDSLKFWFKQAKRRAKIKDFRWHDLRRHSCSLLFERGLSLAEVQTISGHRDPRILLNTYTRLDPKKIVKKLSKEVS